MGANNLPRQETEAQRKQAYKELRKTVKRSLFRVTPLSDDKDRRYDKDTAIKGFVSEEGKAITVERTVKRNKLNVLDGDIIKIIVRHDSQRLGPRTTYEAEDNNPFTRRDEDPQELGFKEFSELPKSTLVEKDYATGALIQAISRSIAAREENARTGLDSQPITAEEADSVRLMIENARPNEVSQI